MNPDVERLTAAAEAPLENDTPATAAFTPLLNGVVLTAADTVRAQPVRWAAEGRIPLGGVTVLCGDPGLGKSTLALNLVAGWSCGRFDGDLKGVPVSAVIASAEDSVSHTLVPRLKAADADLSRVHFVSVYQKGMLDTLTLPVHMNALRARMLEVGAKVLVVDPLFAHLSSALDSHRDQDIRRAMAPLHRLADELDAAVLVILHLNKAQLSEAIYRVGGSIGTVAAARSVLLFGADPSDPDSPIRLLAHAKSNLSPLAITAKCELKSVTVTDGMDTIETSKIVWHEAVPGIAAADLLVKPEREPAHNRDEAKAWLQARLADGAMPADDLVTEARRLGFSEATLRRAKTDLGIKSRKAGFDGSWCWALPNEGAQGTDEGPSTKKK